MQGAGFSFLPQSLNQSALTRDRPTFTVRRGEYPEGLRHPYNRSRVRAYPEFRMFDVILRKEKHHGPESPDDLLDQVLAGRVVRARCWTRTLFWGI